MAAPLTRSIIHYGLACVLLMGVGACGNAATEPETPPTPQPQATNAPEPSGETITTESGLQYIELQQGNGRVAQAGKRISVHYTGWLLDGTKFDSSIDRGQAFEFQLGRGAVIRGWDQGVSGMQVGGRRQLIIPPHLGYGEEGSPPNIPPFATLVFEVQLLAVY